jgi:3-oxoacyl-[acyl-carrier-protein] synthase-3
MKTVSLFGTSSFLPDQIVFNDFFGEAAHSRRGMFTAPTTRRHVRRDDVPAAMIERAALKIRDRLDLNFTKDVDLLLTNVTIPDEPFSGCGADVARRLDIHPHQVIDLHNAGCVSFIYMLELARLIMNDTDARGALLCNVQNAAGRLFAQPGVRRTSQAPVPGDGCGVGFVAASNAAPVLAVVHRLQPEFATDMTVVADDGRRYWEPGTAPFRVAFDEERVAAIIARGNSLVPEIVREACRMASITPRDINLLVTNQPNPIFLRNWREALELPASAHHDTYDKYGNLFGAAIPINLEDAVDSGRLKPGDLVALGGFAHAGDYCAAAVVRWQSSRDTRELW